MQRLLVMNSNAAPQVGTPDKAGAQAAWGELNSSGRDINIEAIDEIASKYGVMAGKWMSYPEENNTDHRWGLIAHAIVDGQFGASCYKAGVGIKKTDKQRTVISIHNDNYKDTKEVMKIEKTLRDLGLTDTLMYKPDVYSSLEIYGSGRKRSNYYLPSHLYRSFWKEEIKMSCVRAYLEPYQKLQNPTY